MDNRIDLAKVRQQAKDRWLYDQRRRVGFLDRVEGSIPWWLVIIAGTLFILSAPHTAHTFAQLTPGFGLAAPLFVEFGLLYAAFERKKRRQRKEAISNIVWGLEVLLFLTAIIVNGAGSFSAVVVNVGLVDLPFGEMLDRFGHLPATAQVALILVPIAALIIPIGTAVAGEGLAALVFERQVNGDDTETRWAEAAPGLLYVAFFDALVAAGYTPGKAKALAAAYSGTSASIIVENPGMVEIPENAGMTPELPEKTPLGKGEARQRLDELFRDDPSIIRLPVEKLMERTGAGKSAVYEWRKEKTSQEG